MMEFKNNENLVHIMNVIHLKDLKIVCILMEECNTCLKDYKFKLNNM